MSPSAARALAEKIGRALRESEPITYSAAVDLLLTVEDILLDHATAEERAGRQDKRQDAYLPARHPKRRST